jgi:hypothetical protein
LEADRSSLKFEDLGLRGLDVFSSSCSCFAN